MSFDAQRLLDTATAFFLAAERCVPDFQFGRYGLHSIGAPTIVCYAFSLELALKLLHGLHSGALPRGHSLKRLFDDLPQESRDNLAYMETISNAESGERVIDEIDRYFEKWRYAFEYELLIGENDNLRRGFILCYQEVRRLRPNLSSIYEQNWGGFEPDWCWAWPEQQLREFEDDHFQAALDDNRRPHEGINL